MPTPEQEVEYGETLKRFGLVRQDEPALSISDLLPDAPQTTQATHAFNPLVLYHKDCADGFGAALVAWDSFITAGVPIVTVRDFHAVQYGQSEVPDVTDCDVFILDFSFPRAVLEAMREKAHGLVVIDHHKTAAAELEGLDYCTFDMSKSGAVLTWEHFHPSEPVPPLLEYLQDRDLWKWELHNSREISAAIRSYAFSFPVWRIWLTKIEALMNLFPQGAAILRYQQTCIERALSRPPEMVEIDGYQVPCANSTHLISELGDELAKGHPFAALYFDTADGKRVFSLRSAPDGVDVAEVAKKMGGGGHPHAAGFSVERPPIL